ncbi:neurofilament heavy polypeptide [Anopheles moucheti]|uniref:neurofilament heavy polypeptide n=1 Tax=Anopheles moucheti TaxID=186751 RepID=UPI0022F0F1C9|nr:neurofilament heavy polypeptide [Anopheles moucheti]
MPTQKKKMKKANETSEGKSTVDIKQEPEELKPLSAYVDDRLELIRQVFSCVKPKEIKYLLPDFLEGKSNDIIKERCLDELLGISTKRLHSIINNAKCPTDTESSSEGSDVEKIEEHISLDEISSDSDVDSKRVPKRSKKVDNSKQTDEKNGEPKSEKEMTVLELLELQARARAIRSQLALEPVTKIEIESEHEGEDGRHGDVDTDDESKQPARMRTTLKTSESTKNGNDLKNENSAQQQTKRVRLKRNFRIRKVGDEDDDDQEVSSNPPDNGREKSTEQAVEDAEPEASAPEKTQEEEKSTESVKLNETGQSLEKESSPVEQEIESTAGEENVGTQSVNVQDTSETIEKENVPDSGSLHPDEDEKRESSPEVIPVEASPETLCISSDSEEERLAKERASIFVPNIEELDRQAKKVPTPEPEKPAEDTEPEEGELSEEEQEPAPVESVAEQQCDPTGVSEETTRPDTVAAESVEDGQKETEQSEVQGNVLEAETVEKSKDAQETEIQTLSSSSDESDGSGSGSSSDSSTEAEDDEAKGEPTKLDNSAHDDEDIVEIHDSGDENLLLEDKPPEEEAKSWNTRWLKSSRVAKVMAASRLGNKVREKLKKKKQIQLAAEQQQQQQQQQEPIVDSPEVSQPSPKTSEAVVGELPRNIELGSVEHYRELIAQQENKQD